MRIKKYGDLGVGIFFMVLSLVFFVMAAQIPKSMVMSIGPQVMPQVYAVITFGLSGGLIFFGVKKVKQFDPAKEESVDRPEYVRVLLTIVSFTAYVMLLQPIGFLLMTFVYLAAQMLILAPAEKRKPILFIIIALVTTLFVYFLFRNVFSILLPRGILG